MDQAIELRSAQSRRILRCACSAGRSVDVVIKGRSPAEPIAGRLVDMTDECVAMIMPATFADEAAVLLNRYCEVNLALDDGHYFFDSHVVGARTHAQGCELHVAVPPRLAVHQRRLQQRKTMALSSIVQLSRDVEGQLHTCQGQLFNLSSSGLAVRLTHAEAEMLAVDTAWSVCFELPGQDHVYKFEAQVIRQTPVNDDAMIVGIRFATGESRDELEHLMEFLCGRELPASRA